LKKVTFGVLGEVIFFIAWVFLLVFPGIDLISITSLIHERRELGKSFTLIYFVTLMLRLFCVLIICACFYFSNLIQNYFQKLHPV
jgi:hypothetical protein